MTTSFDKPVQKPKLLQPGGGKLHAKINVKYSFERITFSLQSRRGFSIYKEGCASSVKFKCEQDSEQGLKCLRGCFLILY